MFDCCPLTVAVCHRSDDLLHFLSCSKLFTNRTGCPKRLQCAPVLLIPDAFATVSLEMPECTLLLLWALVTSGGILLNLARHSTFTVMQVSPYKNAENALMLQGILSVVVL